MSFKSLIIWCVNQKSRFIGLDQNKHLPPKFETGRKFFSIWSLLWIVWGFAALHRTRSWFAQRIWSQESVVDSYEMISLLGPEVAQQRDILSGEWSWPGDCLRHSPAQELQNRDICLSQLSGQPWHLLSSNGLYLAESPLTKARIERCILKKHVTPQCFTSEER
jgi:hypothetical protein